MTALEFLSQLRSQGVALWLEDERLRYRAPAGVLIPALRRQLTDRKEEIVAFLRLAQSGAVAASGRVEPVARGEAMPCSFAQQRLWFLQQLAPDSFSYSVPVALRLRGRLSLAALEQAIKEIVRRHETLRTTFKATDDGAVQVISPAADFQFSVVDIGNLGDPESVSQELMREETSRAFDLATGPMLRARLLQLAEDEEIVLINLHHIAVDGWSMGLLVREVAALYEAFVAGEPSPLAELKIQYADFAAWQLAWLRGEVLEKQLAYWRQQLSGAPPTLDLPTDHPRTASAGSRGEEYVFELPPELLESLRNLSQQEGVTIFMTLLAAFQTLLYKYTGQDDIVVGAPIAGRNLPEIENLVGFFVNTLALRTDLSGDPTFRELLRRVRETSLHAYANQDVPFELLVEELKPDRSLHSTPLFQAAFTLQSAPREELQLPGLQVSIIEVENASAKFDLSLDLTETTQDLLCRLRYDAKLFTAATIKDMAGHFERLLTAALSAPHQRISQLEILRPEERQKLLYQWNDTRRGYQLERCIPQLIEAQVERSPAAIAVAFQDEQLTYRELNEQANRLAWKLIEMGIGSGSYVPVLLDRSMSLPVAWLGIMKTGAAFVPLDTGWPPQRLQQVLGDLESEVVLVNRETPERADELKCAFINVEDQIASGPAVNPGVELNPEQPIYVMYTSGSTGKPKGVVVPHRGITNRFLWMNEFFRPEAGGAVLQTTRQVYDSAVWQLFWPLLSGGKTVIPSPEMELTADSLATLIEQHGVTMTDFVPSVFNVIVPQLAENSEWKERLQTLRCVIVGGEEITAATAFEFRRLFPAVKIVNLYGPTEASIGCICYELTGDESSSRSQRIPIGKPIANAGVLILDHNQQLVPVGVRGELYLTGVCLGLGYLNDQEQTNAVFVANPYRELGWRTLYKTGDLGRYLPDGNIEFLGRCDHQVKIRGFRIELGEIETILRGHREVSECVVIAREDGLGEKRLVAYVVPREAAGCNARDLREHLKDRLPGYMVPSGFVKLEAMPLTPGGKLDLRRLPEPEWDRDQEPDVNDVRARTAVEEIITGIWAELLGRKRVGVDEDFFAIGGHSLLATQVISRLRSVLQLEVPLRFLFEEPTVAGLAGKVDALLRQQQGLQTLPPLHPVSREANLPLSSAQRRLWFLDQLTPGSPAYNLPGAVRLEGSLNVSALDQSFAELLRRHESLRTSFAVSDGNPVQIINQPVFTKLPICDLSSLSEHARGIRLQSLIGRHANYCFDLSRGPMLHAAVVKLTGAEYVLLFNIHHIVSDAWSIDVLISEIAALYEAFSAGRPSPLNELSIQYADFAVWQQHLLRGELFDRELAYWREQLAGAPPLELPADRPRPAVLTYRGSQAPLNLTADLTDRLKALSRRAGVTLFMTLVAAWQALLNRYTDQEDLSIGLAVANRNHEAMENLIGFFVNMLVLRTDLSGNPTFTELLERVREVCMQAYAHQNLPFEKLVEHLQPERDLSRTPFFQVVLQMLNTAKPKLQVSGLQITPLEIESGMPHFDLILSMTESEDGLNAILEYNSDLFDAARIRQMLDHYQTLLTGIVEDPSQRLWEIPLKLEAPAAAFSASVQRQYQDHQFTFETI